MPLSMRRLPLVSMAPPVTVHAKILRLELLHVKADLERELGTLVLHCSDCGGRVHWVAGLGITPVLAIMNSAESRSRKVQSSFRS
jgi:hypothetical protein